MNFEAITENSPGDRETLLKLRDLLSKHADRRAEFTLNDFCDEIEPKSRELMAVILGEFVRRGWLKLIVRVESPTKGGGIGEFDSIDAVPDFLYDERADRRIEVDPDDLRVVYATP